MKRETVQLETALACTLSSIASASIVGGAIGGGLGAASGYLDTRTLDGALQGFASGAAWGAAGGALYGALNPFVCFVEGTEVFVPDDQDADQSVPGVSTAAAVATTSGAGVRTEAIELIVLRGGGEGGSGGGQYLMARDENDPDGPLVPCEIIGTFERIAYRLQVIKFLDEQGVVQVHRVTEEHPYFRMPNGWTPCRFLEPDQIVRGRRETLRVVENLVEKHPEGVKVFNVKVKGAHTYFVRGEGSRGELVWVHNASYSTLEERINATPAGQYGTPEQALRGTWTGDRGRSTFVPSDIPENAGVIATLQGNGLEGIAYRMGIPVFGSLAEGTVNTSFMTSVRRANFGIADSLLAEQWGWSAEDLTAYRINNNLTWHEMNNMQTMQLIPGDINAFFDHLGGVAEAKRAGL